MNALVGYTGFVGSNIYKNGNFDFAYNSKNIEDAYGTNPDLLVYAGVSAEKYLANVNPKEDMGNIIHAMDNIKKINPKKLVLISTVDVIKNPCGMDEDSVIDTEGLHPYGYNRLQLENWVRENYEDAIIIRLPGLFGENIKKNFIYDFIHVIPFMLKYEKMEELSRVDSELKNYYTLLDNNFYRLNELDMDKRNNLKEKFNTLGFSALNFTDSRSVFQFYNLDRLWNDIQIAINNNIRLLHPATEPVEAGELYKYLTGKKFENEIASNPVKYDYRTKYASLFGGKDNSYIQEKSEVLSQIKEFINNY